MDKKIIDVHNQLRPNTWPGSLVSWFTGEENVHNVSCRLQINTWWIMCTFIGKCYMGISSYPILSYWKAATTLINHRIIQLSTITRNAWKRSKWITCCWPLCHTLKEIMRLIIENKIITKVDEDVEKKIKFDVTVHFWKYDMRSGKRCHKLFW